MLEKGVIFLNHLVIELIFYTCIAALFSTEIVRGHFFLSKTYIDRIAAVVLGGFGLRLFFSR